MRAAIYAHSPNAQISRTGRARVDDLEGGRGLRIPRNEPDGTT